MLLAEQVSRACNSQLLKDSKSPVTRVRMAAGDSALSNTATSSRYPAWEDEKDTRTMMRRSLDEPSGQQRNRILTHELLFGRVTSGAHAEVLCAEATRGTRASGHSKLQQRQRRCTRRAGAYVAPR